MAGYNGRFLYDQCTFDQNLQSSLEPCKYQLLGDKFENKNMEIGKDQCIKTNNMGCKPCNLNNNANVEANWSSIGLRTDIESELWIMNRPISRCDIYKYSKCSNKCPKGKCVSNCDKKCPNYVVINTLICDRNIVPTNNKMPLTSGF